MKSGVIVKTLPKLYIPMCFELPYLCENSSKVSSPCSLLRCTAEELKGDLALRVVVVGATRAALGAARTTGLNNDEDGRAAARKA